MSQQIPTLTFADIDKTEIKCASELTMNLIRCKQAINRASSYIDKLVNERVCEICDAEVLDFVNATNIADNYLDTIIIHQIDSVLLTTDFKNI